MEKKTPASGTQEGLPAYARPMTDNTGFHPINLNLGFANSVTNTHFKGDKFSRARVGDVEVKREIIGADNVYLHGYSTINKSLRVIGSDSSFRLVPGAVDVDGTPAPENKGTAGYSASMMTGFRCPCFVLRTNNLEGRKIKRYRVYSLTSANEALRLIHNAMTAAHKTQENIDKVSHAFWNRLGFLGFQITHIPMTSNGDSFGRRADGTDDFLDDEVTGEDDCVLAFEVAFRVQTHAVWLPDVGTTDRLSVGTRLYFVFTRMVTDGKVSGRWIINPVATTKPLVRSLHCDGWYTSARGGAARTRKRFRGDFIQVGKVLDAVLSGSISHKDIYDVQRANNTRKRTRDDISEGITDMTKRTKLYKGCGRIHLSSYSFF